MTARQFLESIGLEVSEQNFALLSEYFCEGYYYVSFPDAEIPDFDDPETQSDFESFVILREEEE